MTFTVRPSGDGGWHAFASGPRLLVTPVAGGSFVDAAWAAISMADGFRLSLDLLASNGFAATPAFLLIEWITGAEARIIQRGDSPLWVTDALGSQSLSASGVSTWVERSIPAVTGIHFSVPGGTPIGTASLPFDAGVALVAEVDFGVPGPTATVVPVAPAAAVPPVLAPMPAPVPVPMGVPVPATEVDVEVTVREVPDEVPVLAESSAVSRDESDDAGYDYLFGDTVYRSVADAVVHRPEVSEDDAEGSDVIDDALHDGETVLTADIAKIRGRRGPKPGVDLKADAPTQKLVLAISSTGARESLSQPILVGRSPSVSKISGGQIPRMLTVGTPDQDISRNHVQVSIEGGTVVVTDLHSRNGTMVELPGKSPQKLRAGEPTSVIVGTVIDLGSGVTLTVEDDAAGGTA